MYDLSSIYHVPLLLESQNVLEIIKKHLNLRDVSPTEISKTIPNMIQWRNFCN